MGDATSGPQPGQVWQATHEKARGARFTVTDVKNGEVWFRVHGIAMPGMMSVEDWMRDVVPNAKEVENAG